MDQDQLSKLTLFMQKLNLPYKDLNLINQAFLHSSLAHQTSSLQSNERLEFLGDSVLSMCVSEYLFLQLPQAPEGKLTKMRSYLVAEKMLAKLAKKIQLDTLLLLSWGEENSGGRSRDANLADTFEAFLGALFLDNGFDVVKNFVLEMLKEEAEKVKNDDFIFDYKTEFQYMVQQKYKKCPEYRIAQEEGPPHQKTFVSELILNGRVLTKGMGFSKKKSEQEAAKKALDLLKRNKIKL